MVQLRKHEFICVLFWLLLAAVVIANERRSESVQAAFLELFSPSFTFKKVPLSKQDPDYCHPAIEIYLLKKKKGASDANLVEMERQQQDLETMQQQEQEQQQQQQQGQQQQEHASVRHADASCGIRHQQMSQ